MSYAILEIKKDGRFKMENRHEEYMKQKLRLSCQNMIREDDELKSVICLLTSKNCVCCSCANPHIGFVENTWAKNCPSYKVKEENGL